MLNEIRLRNFKSHAETALEAKRITLFIGPNNSGKSSVGQALTLLRQVASQGDGHLTTPVQRKPTSPGNPYLYPEDQLIDLGNFEDVVRKGQREIVIELKGDVNVTGIPGVEDRFSANFEVEVRNNVLFFHRGKIAFRSSQSSQPTEVVWQWTSGAPQQAPAPTVRFAGCGLRFTPSANFQLLSGGGAEIPPNINREASVNAELLAGELSRAPLSLLKSVHPIFPLRGLEERGSPLTDVPAKNLERMCVADRTVALLSMLAYDLDLQEKISNWLDKLVQLRIKVPLLPGKRVTLLGVSTNTSRADSLFMNEGTGANQLPFILVPIGITPPGETILLAEPEVHLHPKLQSKLVSLLLSLVRDEGRQFLIETHSEHILHSVLNSVARGELSTGDLAIYYFEKKDGVAECRKLDVSPKGQIDGGLPGFFEQSLDELTEYLDALKKVE